MSKISTQPRSKQAALFGAQLRGWREHRGMTQSEAARALKIDKGYLCRVELGRHKPRPPLLRELIRLYAIGSRGLGNLRGSRWLNQQGGYKLDEIYLEAWGAGDQSGVGGKLLQVIGQAGGTREPPRGAEAEAESGAGPWYGELPDDPLCREAELLARLGAPPTGSVVSVCLFHRIPSEWLDQLHAALEYATVRVLLWVNPRLLRDEGSTQLASLASEIVAAVGKQTRGFELCFASLEQTSISGLPLVAIEAPSEHHESLGFVLTAPEPEARSSVLVLRGLQLRAALESFRKVFEDSDRCTHKIVIYPITIQGEIDFTVALRNQEQREERSVRRERLIVKPSPSWMFQELNEPIGYSRLVSQYGGEEALSERDQKLLKRLLEVKQERQRSAKESYGRCERHVGLKSAFWEFARDCRDSKTSDVNPDFGRSVFLSIRERLQESRDTFLLGLLSEGELLTDGTQYEVIGDEVAFIEVDRGTGRRLTWQLSFSGRALVRPLRCHFLEVWRRAVDKPHHKTGDDALKELERLERALTSSA